MRTRICSKLSFSFRTRHRRPKGNCQRVIVSTISYQLESVLNIRLIGDEYGLLTLNLYPCVRVQIWRLD